VVRALVGVLRKDARPIGEVMRLGWRSGADAQGGGLSLRHVVRDGELLLAVLLAETERVLAAAPADVGGTPAEAIAVARRLHQGVGSWTQAAVSGFVHAFLGALRERYRVLRHDLRNPLGTIQSALSLMEDESVPLELRQGPNVRAMVARNAGSLERLIAAGLDDSAAAGLFAAAQEVVVRDVALAARREVRDVSRSTGLAVAVEVPAGPSARVDAAALELALTALYLSAAARAAVGDLLVVQAVAAEPGPALAAGAAPLAEGEAAPVELRLVLRPGAARGAPAGGIPPLDDLPARRAAGAGELAAVAPGVPDPSAWRPADDPSAAEPEPSGHACAEDALAGDPDGDPVGDPVAGEPRAQDGPDEDGGNAGAPAPRWDPDGLALAVSLLADHGGRLSAVGRPPVGEGRPVRAEDVASALVCESALLLTLPVRSPGDPRTLRRRATDGRPARS
jgi:hypothetical protein